MVSMPNYDPYDLASRTETQVEDTAYLNRCLQGLYTPGSVFKIVTLASALDNDANVVGQNFSCSGILSLLCGLLSPPARQITAPRTFLFPPQSRRDSMG